MGFNKKLINLNVKLYKKYILIYSQLLAIENTLMLRTHLQFSYTFIYNFNISHANIHHNCPLIIRTEQTHAAESRHDFIFNVIFAFTVHLEKIQAFVMKVFGVLCDADCAQIITVELVVLIQLSVNAISDV